MAKQSAGSIRNVGLGHGGFVDGSGWEAVYRRLRQQGFTVSVVQNPITTLADDAKATRWILAQQDGPVILVGHSYGGLVITEAGNDPTVAGLVYVAAFAPDAGESVASFIKDPPAGAPVPPILPPRDGYLLLDKSKFAASFAADVDPELAAFMGDARCPGSGGARRRGEPAGLEVQAELGPGGHGGSDHSSGRAARHVPARGFNRR